MKSINEFINQGSRELSEEIDRILKKKLKVIIQSIERELKFDMYSRFEQKELDKVQLVKVLKEVVDPDEHKNYLGGVDVHKRLEEIGYKIVLEQPLIKSHIEKVVESNGSYSVQLFITENDIRVKLYRLEYEA